MDEQRFHNQQEFCADTGYNLEDLPGAMDDRDGWQERSVLAARHDDDDDDDDDEWYKTILGTI